MSVRRLTYAQKSALLQIVRHGDAYPADGNHRRTYQSLEARGYAEDVGYGRYAIDVNVTAWKIGPVIIMRGTATPTARVSHPECFGRFTVIALSCDGAIRKCMRRVAMMCARHSACERLDRQEARG